MLILQQNRRQTTSERSGFILTGPVTITRVLTKFTTFGQPLTTLTQSSSSTTIFTTVPFTSAIPPAQGTLTPQIPSPPRPVITPPARDSLEEKLLTTTSRSPALPPRAIVGVVIGGLTLLLLGLFFFLRRRAIHNRKRMRSIWTQSTLVQLPPAYTSPIGEKAEKPSRSVLHVASALPLPDNSQPNNNDLREDWRLSSIGRPMSIPTPMLSPQFAPPAKSEMTQSYRSSVPLSLTPITISSDAMSMSASAPPLVPSSVPRSAMGISFQEAELPFNPYDALVVSTYLTALGDELRISLGESVRVLKEFSDGWCYSENGRGELGVVPIACLRPSHMALRLTVPGRDLEFDRSSFGRGSSLGVVSILGKDFD